MTWSSSVKLWRVSSEQVTTPSSSYKHIIKAFSHYYFTYALTSFGNLYTTVIVKNSTTPKEVLKQHDALSASQKKHTYTFRVEQSALEYLLTIFCRSWTVLFAVKSSQFDKANHLTCTSKCVLFDIKSACYLTFSHLHHAFPTSSKVKYIHITMYDRKIIAAS